jgi:glycosyltransferase involved in cell wall biosynthesis
LERAAELPPTTILFGAKRYDFDEHLAEGLHLVPARSWRSAWWLMRHPVQTLEINEPLMLPAVQSTALALAGLAVARIVGRPRTRVVSYAIENLDPSVATARVSEAPRLLGMLNRLERRLKLLLAKYIWRRVDRVAFGTSAAQQLYARRLPNRTGQAQALIWALPAPVTGPVDKQPCQVLFLGAFTDRKGFSLLVRAWPLVRTELPEARLLQIGKGHLLHQAERLAANDSSVRLLVDPPRAEIRAQLARSQVVVLASQRQRAWREQVGLPIVEGLSYGCTVVTTEETGLASWLAVHGHRVLPARTEEADLARAIVDALRQPVVGVRESLPAKDGRLRADEWMFA